MELAEETDLLTQLRNISYSEQYDIIFDGEVDAKKVNLSATLSIWPLHAWHTMLCESSFW